jgi:hypothetical protein
MLFLLGSIVIKIFKTKSFFVSKWRPFINLKNYLFQRYFELKCLNGCHFEMKEAFDLKIFMMIDPNKNNIQPEITRFYQSVEKLLVFCNLHLQTDRR